VWDLAADVADGVLDGNPHADKHGNADTWSFVFGAAPVAPTYPPAFGAGVGGFGGVPIMLHFLKLATTAAVTRVAELPVDAP